MTILWICDVRGHVFGYLQTFHNLGDLSFQYEDKEVEPAAFLQWLPETSEQVSLQSLNILPLLQLQEHEMQVGMSSTNLGKRREI